MGCSKGLEWPNRSCIDYIRWIQEGFFGCPQKCGVGNAHKNLTVSDRMVGKTYILKSNEYLSCYLKTLTYKIQSVQHFTDNHQYWTMTNATTLNFALQSVTCDHNKTNIFNNECMLTSTHLSLFFPTVEQTSTSSSISFLHSGLQDSCSPPSQIVPNPITWYFLPLLIMLPRQAHLFPNFQFFLPESLLLYPLLSTPCVFPFPSVLTPSLICPSLPLFCPSTLLLCPHPLL